MKFEDILPFLRTGASAKCGNQPGYFLVCKKSLFGTDLGLHIYHAWPDPLTGDIFHWGIDGNSLLSDEWEICESDEQPEIQKIESILAKAVHQTIFNFFMGITMPFTPGNALLPPLSEPLADKIIATLQQFFDERKVIE